jgi:serine/threonine protein kinase
MPSTVLVPGSSLGRCRIQGLAGRGGSSEVYLALDTQTEEKLAIKVLTSASFWPPSAAAAALADEVLQTHHALRQALRHPHIVEHREAGVVQGRPWLAFAWTAGTNLSRYTEPSRVLPIPLVLHIATALAQALDHAHRAGWLHRDLKPGNVRIHLPDGIVQLTDFGLAKLADSTATLTGVMQGTPRYMAPELLVGESPSAQSDLYALGVILYEMLCGRSPHQASTLQALLTATLQGQPTPLITLAPDVPSALAELVHTLIHRQPVDRPATAGAVLHSLQALQAASASAPPPKDR